MASIEDVINDPEFRNLSGDDQVAILKRLDLQSSSEPKLIQEPQPRSGFQSFQDIPETQPTARHEGAMPFVNRGISSVMGAPADLVAAGVNALPGMDDTNKIQDPLLGRKSIEQGMSSSGIRLPAKGQRAETIPEHIGQVVGEASAYLLPVTKTVQGLAQIGGTTGRVASSIYSSMIKHPYLTMASELSGSVSAGAGRGVAEKEFPDSPGVQSAIEIISGLAGAIAPTALVNKPSMVLIRTGKSLYRKLITPFTKKGGKYRAGEFAKGLVKDPAKVSTGTISDLPPAVASGEKKVVELYKGLSGLDPVSDADSIERISNSIIKLDNEMQKLGYGSPELLAEITEKRIAAIELGMDKRVIDATAIAEERLSKIPVAQRKAAEGRIVGEELRKVMYAARAENTKKWLTVNKDFETGFEATRQTYGDLIADLGQAQMEDVPAVLKSSKIIRDEKLEKTTIREMQSLRSKLLENSRQARKDGNWNKSRIAENVSDAILVDIETASLGGQKYIANPAIKLRDRTIIEQAYSELKKESGSSNVFISEVVERSGKSVKEVHDWIDKSTTVRVSGVIDSAVKGTADEAAAYRGSIFMNIADDMPYGKVIEGDYALGGHIEILNQIDQNPKYKALYDEGSAVDGGVTHDGAFVEKPLDMDFSEFKTSQGADSAEAANLKAALAHTKQFKTRFESGETAKILGYSKSGAPAINPDLTLEQTVGRLGERGAIDIDKIVATPAARRATERYLGRSFTDYAADTGTVNPVKAQRWIKTNEAILDEYPDLKKLLSNSADAQEFADGTRTTMEARKAKLRDPKISVSARFLNKQSLGTEINDIFKSRNSSRVANELMKQAGKDPSGDAVAGLRAGFVEHILDKATVGSFNELGEQTLSGRYILNFIKKNESTLRMVFDNNQIKRLKRVGTDLSKIETLEGAKGKPNIDMNDWASRTLAMTGRLVGARVGGKIGSGSMGGSLQYASVFSDKGKKFMTWLSHDKAKQFVQDAILSDDPKMLQSLLAPMSKPKPKKQDIILLNRQLNAWLLSTGGRVFNADE